jgi:hypothetical protein
MADDYGFDPDQQMFVAGSLIEAGTCLFEEALIQVLILLAIKTTFSWPMQLMILLGSPKYVHS